MRHAKKTQALSDPHPAIKPDRRSDQQTPNTNKTEKLKSTLETFKTFKNVDLHLEIVGGLLAALHTFPSYGALEQGRIGDRRAARG